MNGNRGKNPRRPENGGRNADWILGTSWEAVRDELQEKQRSRGRRPVSGVAETHPTPANRGRRPNSASPQRERSVGSGGLVKKSAGAAGRTSAGKKPSGKPRKPSGRGKKLKLHREINVKTIIAQIVVVIVVLGGLGYGYQQVTNAKAQLEANQAAAVEKPEEVPNCRASDLEATFTSNATTLQAGNHWIGTVTLKNISRRPCYTEGGLNRQGFKIKSGDVEVFNSLVCAPADSEVPLLLGVGKTWDFQVTWDGKIWDKCNGGEVAKPGTYVASLFQKDTAVGEPAVLTVVPAPAPKPEAKPENKG